MSRQIKIEPVTRLEGHGKVTINLDDAGEVASSQFHVLELRGFEKFMEGRMFWEAPLITPRICGICSVSHHVASAKACDDLLGVDIPPAAKMLRELMHVGEFIGDHALHIFFLAAPDLVFGPDESPAKRNIVGIATEYPEVAQSAIALRKVAQMIVETVGGRSTHPVTAIPGGMSKTLSHDDRHLLLQQAHTTIDHARTAMDLVREALEKRGQLVDLFGGVETHFSALSANETHTIYEGDVTVMGRDGKTLAQFAPTDYANYIGEHAEDWSYLKFPYFKPLGYPEGTYRVGPLARANIAKRMGTPLADEALKDFKGLAKGPVQGVMQYHYARAIGMLHACERTVQLLEDPAICDSKVRIPAQRKAGEGIGIVEAPRGLLIHHYAADEVGRLTKINLVVATTHNNAAINSNVTQAARAFIHKGEVNEGLTNRVEMAVRAYDPCLSCGAHAFGKLGLDIEILDATGQLLQTVGRV